SGSTERSPYVSERSRAEPIPIGHTRRIDRLRRFGTALTVSPSQGFIAGSTDLLEVVVDRREVLPRSGVSHLGIAAARGERRVAGNAIDLVRGVVGANGHSPRP